MRVGSETASSVSPLRSRACTPGKLGHFSFESSSSRPSYVSLRERSIRSKTYGGGAVIELTGQIQGEGRTLLQLHASRLSFQDVNRQSFSWNRLVYRITAKQCVHTLDSSRSAIINSLSKSDSSRLTDVQNIWASRLGGAGLRSNEYWVPWRKLEVSIIDFGRVCL